MSALLVDTDTIVAFVLALGAGIGFGLFGFAVSRLVAPPKPTPLKNERFECGNPPSKEGRGQLTMQYYGYLVVFLTVEPVFIYSFLLLMDAHQAYFTVVALFAVILLMLIPPLIFGLNSARKIHLWKMKEKTNQ